VAHCSLRLPASVSRPSGTRLLRTTFGRVDLIRADARIRLAKHACRAFRRRGINQLRKRGGQIRQLIDGCQLPVLRPRRVSVRRR
jgi:hypothetical protein